MRAVADLPRARCLVLAGSIMGGAITDAVRELREHGVPVIALNMVGSVTDAADLVVSDPVQAGTMAVMAIAERPDSTSPASAAGDIDPAAGATMLRPRRQGRGI